MAKESPFPTFNLSADGVPLCWGCATTTDQLCKLGVQRIDVDATNAVAVAVAQCPASWQGGPGVAHGGWITCIFDEVLGRLPSALDVPCVTATMNVSFRRPVPIERPLTVTARVAERRQRRWVIEGVLRVDGGDDADYAYGTASFVEPALDHFERLKQPDA
ncbi:MAG TPA: PaaI family thioesterase [Mycobacterium sp.]|jgi:acyl-coenzyme A thioesterase PaaI-like protein